MVRRTLVILLFFVANADIALLAEQYSPVPTQPPLGTAPRIVSPPGPVYSLGVPSVERPAINTAPHKHLGLHGAVTEQTTPAGWTGYGFGGVPTYQWGYFGARYRPIKIYHQGYYGHQISYGYRRGY